MFLKCSVFWFKRDLRLYDNDALNTALRAGHPLLLLYILEPSLENDNHFDLRHFNFIKESLLDLNASLLSYNTRVLCLHGEVIKILEVLKSQIDIKTIFSTLEIGIIKTFNRDKDVTAFCQRNNINWIEKSQNAVTRGRQNRDRWRKLLNEYLEMPIENVEIEAAHFLDVHAYRKLEQHFNLIDLTTPDHFFQKGGRTVGMQYAKSFFEKRIASYSDYISKPEMSRFGCSRLSPYIAWGNLSVREVYQRAQELRRQKKHIRQVRAFSSRLRWQSHFIQKFESETRMQKEAVNKGFLKMDYQHNDTYISAWKTGNTGYPLIDASIRAVVETGYINFRMRAMLTSFLTHHLFQHFTTGAPWLAQQFLDFEPGIHYGQMQMQAGLTGINTIRVYNPTKNALDHDPDAVFIKNYLPQLQNLPAALAIEPWNITPMEEVMYNFKYGKDYPKRIIDISKTRKVALEKLYGKRKTILAKNEIKRILDKHTLHKTENRFP